MFFKIFDIQNCTYSPNEIEQVHILSQLHY